MDPEYISVKEFAERAGVSPQAIYQRLEKDLKLYFKVIKGRKQLNIKALELFNVDCFKPVDQHFKADLKQVESHNPTNTAIQEIEALKQLTSTLNDTLKALENQLSIKDSQIQALNEQIKTLNEHLKQAQQLNQNNQILIARQQEPPQQIPEETGKKKSLWDRIFSKN